MSNSTRSNELTKAIITLLESRGCVVWRNNTGAYSTGKRYIRYGHKGSGDILGCTREGRFISLEVKTGYGRPTPEQVGFIARIIQHGGLAGVVRSVAEAQTIIEGAIANPGDKP